MEANANEFETTSHRILVVSMDEMDKRYQQRFEAQEKAIAKSEAAYDKRFESVNEFRGQLSDQVSTFLSRNEFNMAHTSLAEKVSISIDSIINKIESLNKGLSDRIDDLREFRDKSEGQSSSISSAWLILLGLVGLINGLITIFLVFKK